ncbi:hypothetical protein GQ43DRAFT_442116 [Delitschia confertaspora ATCC 74209]|uniref:Acid phosphatase-like protein n=1 Tax=Delitschia confertaspora ATCC 74209 TaxID=1513339 RepID=A0A9P4JMJ0_9PLEO|nr:hypothetical protein GQ43DRAFT_442116 [Delitschia confertaspora ATCC 74209]
MNGWVVFVIILILCIICGFLGWTLYSRIRAQRLGLPPPSLNPFARSSSSPNYPAPAPGGIRGWIDTQIRKLKYRRHATGEGYEEPLGGYSGARGRGMGHRLDPDEAWDARVGNEAYYEEQELGLHAPANENTAYTSPTYGDSATAYASAGPYGAQSQEPERGRSRQSDYDKNSLRAGASNPFGDDQATSLRGVSPRPLETEIYGGQGAQRPGMGHQKKSSVGSVDDSPTERRSIFRENM